MNSVNDYGLWTVVLINSFIFIVFAFSFIRPVTSRDWRSLGAFSAFILALFTEMYGFPLTIYFLSGWLGNRYPGLDTFSHNSGHLWYTLFGLKGDPHSDPFHIISNVLIFAGMFVLVSAWRVLFKAQQNRKLATSGLYSYVRHPQYVAFVIIMLGFLIQWPTLITMVMFPVLLLVYGHLARQEECDSIAMFGEQYIRYAEATPAFIPRFGRAKKVTGNL